MKSSLYRQASQIVFLVYFLFYAVSPLTATLSPNHERGYEDAGSELKAVQVLLWEVIVERVAKEPADHACNSILITKKRALLPENPLAKLNSLEDALAPNDCSVPGPERLPRINGRQRTIPGIHTGFHPLYAGHSPPAA